MKEMKITDLEDADQLVTKKDLIVLEEKFLRHLSELKSDLLKTIMTLQLTTMGLVLGTYALVIGLYFTHH